MELKAGQYVRHAKYGWGTVVDYDRHQTLVFFRSIGIKRLQTDSANFAAVTGETPRTKRLSNTRPGFRSSRAGQVSDG